MAGLKRNIIQCPECKAIIESKHRHDFVVCECGQCAVDGGLDYRRRLGNFIEMSEIEGPEVYYREHADDEFKSL